MSKIVLEDTAGGYNISKINANFDKIEDALNNKVLYRDNVEGEPNQMNDLLDMNSQRIINLPAPESANDAARIQDIIDSIHGAQTASTTPFTPNVNISATTVQGAIVESDTENRALTAALIARLLNPTLTDGAGMVGAGGGLNYAANTIGAFVVDGLVNILWHCSAAQRTQILAGGNTLDITSAINAAKTWGGNRPLYAPKGKYSFTSLSWVLNTGGLVGDGLENTIFECRTAVAKAFDLVEASDANPRAYIFKGFTLNGNGIAVNGMDIKFRHQGRKDDLFIFGFTNTGIKESDTYLTTNINVRSAGNGIGWHLVGSNHNSTHLGCIIDSNSIGQLLIQRVGFAADGNNSLGFTNLVVQSGGASAYGIDIDCDDVTFLCSYIGENQQQPSITTRNGNVLIKGGALFSGFTASAFLIKPLGGRTMVENSVINGQTFTGVEKLIGNGTGGKVYFKDIQANFTVSGTPFFVGDVLEPVNAGNVYTKRFGKQWTGNTNNTTISSVISGNKQTFTCLTAPGPTPLMGASCALSNTADWPDGQKLYFVIVYESSKPVTIRTATGPLGASIINFGTYPATSGGIPNTALCFQNNAVVAPGAVVELVQTTTAVNDTLAIHRNKFSDGDLMNQGSTASAVSNIHL